MSASPILFIGGPIGGQTREVDDDWDTVQIFVPHRETILQGGGTIEPAKLGDSCMYHRYSMDVPMNGCQGSRWRRAIVKCFIASDHVIETKLDVDNLTTWIKDQLLIELRCKLGAPARDHANQMAEEESEEDEGVDSRSNMRAPVPAKKQAPKKRDLSKLTDDAAKRMLCGETGNSQVRSTSMAFSDGWDACRQYLDSCGSIR